MADDPVQSFLETHDAAHIPQPKCCCGNLGCAYLQYNQNALEGLEQDVSQAARLGKALLMRHEAYIADSERERKAMAAQIEELESEKQALEKRNAGVIEENRTLLDQLEALNNAVAESDAQVASLQATLQSTHQELQRLSQLASRTENLERQLHGLEKEQADWQTSLDAKDAAEKTSVHRWQKAERTLAELHDQIERIELEANEERQRHAEIVGRMERRHAVEKELGSAAGRLKGAAALKSGAVGSAPNVVSHFVKDILQDNANLQMGIVELREMLNTSNEEVETLRQQLSIHQPVEDLDVSNPPVRMPDLRQEMTRTVSQEMHVHHHYHAPAAATKTIRKPRRKRTGTLSSGYVSASSGTSTPRSSFSMGAPTSSATILQQTSASVPQMIQPNQRWSVQSSQTQQFFAPSSGPSSPRSMNNRASSIFDRVFSDAGLDSSRPTTPDTEDPGSPVFMPTHSKRASASSFRTFSAPVVSRHGFNSATAKHSLDPIMSIEDLQELEQEPLAPSAIPEENEADWENESSTAPDLESGGTSPSISDLQCQLADASIFRPDTLRRATSHESLLSVSGMDIHTLQSRPSQLLAPYASRALTSEAAISSATAHAARPSLTSRSSASSRSLLSGMAADHRAPAKLNVGKKMGGWMFGRWGTAPSSSESPDAVPSKPVRTPSLLSRSDTGSVDVPPGTPKTAKLPKVRSPGINQTGPILGFAPEVKEQRAPVLRTFDQEGLRDLLDGK